MSLFVIRHGETEMGKNGVIATEREPLNDNGIGQAIEAGKELKKLNIDLVYCSPIERAKHTMKLFNLENTIPIMIEDRLKERDMGIYQNIPFNELDWEAFWGYHSDVKYPELESMKSVYERVSNLLDEIRRKAIDKNVLLVTHGGVIRAISWYFNGFDDLLFQCENCKIYSYHFRRDQK